MAVLRKKLGEILVDMRVLQPKDIDAALKEQQTTGEKIGEIFVRRGMCKAAEVLSALGAQHGMPTVDLSKEVPPHNLQTLIESTYAEQREILPFREEMQGRQKTFHVAMVNPRDVNTLQELEFTLKGKVKPYVGLAGQIKETIRKYYYAQEYGYDMSYHESGGFRFKGPAAEEKSEKVLGQAAPPPGPSADRHPAATSLSDLSASAMRLDKLETEIQRTQHRLATLLRLLADKGVITREDFIKALQR